MNYSLKRRPLRGLALLLPLLAAACTDSSPVAPTTGPTPEGLTALQCTVQVQSGTMSCATVDPTAGSDVKLSRTFGWQDHNIKLASSGSSYDAGTQIFQTNVTVQNLTRQPLGVDSLGNVTGVTVFFFNGPNVTGGTGPVTVFNPTGQGMFTAAGQDYFTFNEALQPNQISSPMNWQFSVPTASTTFSFVVMIRADQPDESMDYEDKVWDGSASTDWADSANWQGSVVPDSGSSVRIPAASLLGGANMPSLTADVQITNLNVGAGSTLSENGWTLTAWGNVDALGTISGGTLWMRGSGVLAGGNLPSVVINGGTRLQRSSVTSGAMSISDGSLVVDGSKPLSISIP